MATRVAFKFHSCCCFYFLFPLLVNNNKWYAIPCVQTQVCFFFLLHFRVIASVLWEAPKLIGYYPALGGFAAFLIALQVLHLFWTNHIIRTGVRPFTTGQVGFFFKRLIQPV